MRSGPWEHTKIRVSKTDPRAAQVLDREINTVLGRFKNLGEVNAPASVVGRSGVRHDFSFAIDKKKELGIVGDVILGEDEKDETKVLSLFIKFYDVGARRAILCVTPRLTPEAARLARFYNILTIETADAKLVPRMLEDLLRSLAR